MIEYVMALIQVLVYMVVRIKCGLRLTYHEKNQVLEGFLKLGQKFIEDYYSRNESEADQLGTTGVEVSSLGDVRVPAISFTKD